MFPVFSRRSMRRALLFATASAVACSKAGDARAAASIAATAAIHVTDDAGFSLTLPAPARRIISLIPSATETLIAIGATKQLVGRTRYDVAPEVAALPSVGGGIDPSVEAIVALHPDIVISWASDKRQAIRGKLVSLGVRVFILRTEDTTDIFRGIATIGRLSGHDSAAAVVARAVRDTLAAVHTLALGRTSPSLFYVVFNDPPMTAGPNTFIGQLIDLAGGRSIFADSRTSWPNVAMEEIVRRDPDMIIAPVGEFRSNVVGRFHELAGWRDMRAVRAHRVIAVPADLMNRPSPSVAYASEVLFEALHPGMSADSVRRAVAALVARRGQ